MSSGFFQAFADDYAQMLACPDPLLLEDFRLGRLEAGPRASVQAHLGGCAACRERLRQLEALPASGAVEPDSESRPAEASELPAETRPAFALGQIWSTVAELDLSAHGLPAAAPVKAGFLRLFVITALGPRHFGSYQELSLCPLNELSELASATDLLLEGPDTPFDEPMMLETGNCVQALGLQLERHHGELAPRALADALALLAGTPSQARRGGKILSPEGPHARFQALEQSQLAYLAVPLAALAELRRLSSRYLLAISPKGLRPPATETPPSPLFAARRPRREPDRVLAAATAEPSLTETPLQPWKETLVLSETLLVDLWVEAGNLEFFAYTPEQLPVPRLRIGYPDAAGALQSLDCDELGTAFVPLSELGRGELLLSFERGELRKLMPIQFEA